MTNEELILNPEYYCPVCQQKMRVIFYDSQDEPMDIVKATCPSDHEFVLRIKKYASVEEIIGQMDYIITSKGGSVFYIGE